MAADGGRKVLRGLGVLLALGLSVAAVLLVVFGKDAKTIRVGVLLGAWGLMFGGLSLYPRRNAPVVQAVADPGRPTTSKALELRDDAAARREFERVLEAMLHRELDRGLRSELDSLHTEMAGLRGDVGQAMRNQVSLERVETRIVGADLADLQDEVRRHGPAEPTPARLAGPPKLPNPEITEVIAAVRENGPPPSPPRPVSVMPPAPAPPYAFAPAPTAPPAPVPASATPTVAPTATPRPAWSPSSVDLPSMAFTPPPSPQPTPPPVRPPVTAPSAPLGARRMPPMGPPRPSVPQVPAPAPPPARPASEPVPQFAVPGPPVWTGPSSADLSIPARPVDSVVPRPASSLPLGNGTSLPLGNGTSLPRSTAAATPQEMRWPWQEEAKRAADPASTPLAPRLTPSVPSFVPAPRPVSPAEDARPTISRSDPFAGLPRLTPASELDLPELLPDLPMAPPVPPAPPPAPMPVRPAPSPTAAAMMPPTLSRHSDAPPEGPPQPDAYVGRRRAAH